MRAENILNEGLKLLKSKGDDYTTDRLTNQHENFERVAVIASWFRHDMDKPYAVLVATKIARLAALLSTGKEPHNESLLDTFTDLANYAALWGSARVKDRETCKICRRPTCDGTCISNQVER